VLSDLLSTVQSTVSDVSKRHVGSVAPTISAMSIMISLLSLSFAVYFYCSLSSVLSALCRSASAITALSTPVMLYWPASARCRLPWPRLFCASCSIYTVFLSPCVFSRRHPPISTLTGRFSRALRHVAAVASGAQVRSCDSRYPRNTSDLFASLAVKQRRLETLDWRARSLFWELADAFVASSRWFGVNSGWGGC
jgi:hypothetical protein